MDIDSVDKSEFGVRKINPNKSKFSSKKSNEDGCGKRVVKEKRANKNWRSIYEQALNSEDYEDENF